MRSRWKEPARFRLATILPRDPFCGTSSIFIFCDYFFCRWQLVHYAFQDGMAVFPAQSRAAPTAVRRGASGRGSLIRECVCNITPAGPLLEAGKNMLTIRRAAIIGAGN